MTQKEFTSQHINSNIVVSSRKGNKLSVRAKDTSLETAFQYVPKNEHDELYGTIVVGGPHYQSLPRNDQKASKEAAKKFFSGPVSVLNGDEAYYNLVGELPPWNKSGEGVSIDKE